MKKKSVVVEIRETSLEFPPGWNPLELQLDVRELLIGIARANGVRVTSVREPKRTGKVRTKRTASV